jgi:PAS domain S-box-containing protein
MSEARAREDGNPLFRQLVAGVREYAIFLFDTHGVIVTWNVGAQRIFGFAADEVIGHHVSIFHPDGGGALPAAERALAEASREGRHSEEGWRLRKDGSRFWAHVAVSAVRDQDDVLLGFAAVIRDMTDRKLAAEDQAARLAAEERFRLMIESVRDYAIVTLEPDGRIATWNESAQRIEGYGAAEIVGRHISIFLPDGAARASEVARRLELAARDGRFEDEGWRVRKDGSRFWANVVLSPYRDAAGALIGFVKVTRDLTDRRAAEETAAARRAAEQANRAKDEFLAMLGHELRNPLAPMLTALQLMKLRGSPHTREQEVIERQVHHMMRLIDDLLDIARITRGTIELARERVDLRGPLARAIEIASPLLEQRAHRLQLDVPDAPITVDGDEARLTQIFANLLTNAAKYTEAGGNVAVRLEKRGGEVVVEVSDDGIGIDPALLPQIFELFVQGRQDAARSSGGLGLGLAVVRSLVELHGGRVEARAGDGGRGSTFTVHLPALAPTARVPSAEPPPAAVPAPTRERVLVVDDNVDALSMLAEGLTALGCDVRTAPDGVAALAALEDFEPEVAILDIGLPVMDGYELAAHIRVAQGPRAPRMIALTGYGQASDIARSRRAGFDAHLVKPIQLQQVVAAIRGAD